MGMDVFGKNPDDPVGEYFRANVWYWCPLWNYVDSEHPDLGKLVESPYTNDGDGLNATNARILGNRLLNDVISGCAQRYADEYDATIAALEDVECPLCHGTGTRTDWPEHCTDEWIAQCNGCNGCKGTGKQEPWAAHYHFSVNLLTDFAGFLQHCGGFSIC